MKRICRGLAVLPMWCLALVLAFGTVLLSACAPEDAPADDPAPVEREAEPTDDVEPEPEPDAQEAVWVVTKDTQTYTVGEDSSSAVVEYELDGHGNVTKVTSDGYVESFERDADGIVTSKTTSYGDDQEVVEYRVERDESGRAVKIVGTDGSVETRSYDDDGNLVERIYQGTYPPMTRRATGCGRHLPDHRDLRRRRPADGQRVVARWGTGPEERARVRARRCRQGRLGDASRVEHGR